ncbi:Hsp20/alpha crystallin family protein [Sporolactobacillus pectinivorans]|uniref:Hsp20/alpha crystallin family protein n=1 Tax=Sporolactobacillus pectinivorans TaxID=1591408 RepID=UPI000C269AA4|nr:Hsp20/alpha crystallin family protein [Sporolactobacillus pectinivorans]
MDEQDSREPRQPMKRNPARRSPMEDLDSFFQQDPFRGILKSIDDFFENHSMFPGGFPVRLYETKDEWVVEADLPGAKRENIHIELLGDRVRIAVENDVEIETEHKEKGTYSHERQFGHAERFVVLPYTIDRAKTQASFQNGVLKVHGPKYPNNGNMLSIE